MKRRDEVERLAVHADRLVGHRGAEAAALAPSDPVQQLLDLAEQLNEVLRPVVAPAGFRRRLKGDLLAARSLSEVSQPGLFEQHRKGILIGAALGSVASVITVIVAFIVRYRHGRASHFTAC